MNYKNFESMPFVLDVSDIADTLKIGRNKAYASWRNTWIAMG